MWRIADRFYYSEENMPTLFLVGTPIGNLEDISQRAIRILEEVKLIAAEDTRTTGRLLKRYQIMTPMVSYHEYSSTDRIRELIEKVRLEDVALVSEAGMPGLSDPGYRLIQEAIKAGIEIVPIPGPSAVIAALVSSGLPSDNFLYLGFLPRQGQARRKTLTQVAQLPYTLVIYEAPHRLRALLSDLISVLGDRPVSISREMTKLHEETWRGSIDGALDYFDEDRIRGEFTIVVGGASQEKMKWDEASVQSALTDLINKGVPRNEAAKQIAKISGWRRRDLYDLTLKNDE